MKFQPFSEGSDKARFVSDMFSRIAGRYDLMNGLMTFGMHHAWRRVAARQTIAAPEGPALDLATGTGDLALELRQIHPRRVIVGADFAFGMLRIAREKLDRAATFPGFTPLFRFYFHRVVPRVGQLVGGDREAYTYLPQSVDRFLAPAELSRLMGTVGLRGVTCRRVGMGTVTIHTGIA